MNQVKPISKNRIIGAKTEQGKLVLISHEDSDFIFNEFIKYLNEMKIRSKTAVQQANLNKTNSGTDLMLECVEEVTVNRNDNIDYQSLIISKSKGNVTRSHISTKKAKEDFIEFYLEDDFGNKIKRTVKVIIVNQGLISA